MNGPVFSTAKSRESYLLYFGRDSPMYPVVDYPTGIYDKPPVRNGTSQQPTSSQISDRYRDRSRSKSRHSRSNRNRSRRRRSNHNDRSNRSRASSSRPSRRGDKMSTGCHQFLRYANLLFTFIVFIAGAGILGLGIYIIGSDYGAQQVSELLGNHLYQIAAYVLIVAGGILVLISMCGCCGALRESRFMLGCFMFSIAVLILALIAAAVIVFVFRQKMEGDIIHSMEDILIEKYGVDLNEKSENRMVTDMWNWLQREMKCCGVTGNINSTTSWAIYRHSEWYKGLASGKPYVPQSCCKEDGDINLCTGISALNGPPSQAPPLQPNYYHNTELYTDGCYDELVNYIQSHAVIIGVSSIAAVVVMIFGFFFSFFLCRRIDVDYTSYTY